MEFKVVKTNREDREKHVGFKGQIGFVGNRMVAANDQRYFVTSAVKKITIETANTVYELEVLDNEARSR